MKTIGEWSNRKLTTKDHARQVDCELNLPLFMWGRSQRHQPTGTDVVQWYAYYWQLLLL